MSDDHADTARALGHSTLDEVMVRYAARLQREDPELLREWVQQVIREVLDQNAVTLVDDLVGLLAGRQGAEAALVEPYELAGEDAALSLSHWRQSHLLELGAHRQTGARTDEALTSARRDMSVFLAVACRMEDENAETVGAVDWFAGATP